MQNTSNDPVNVTNTSNERVNIIFSSDLHFIPYFATSLYSLLANFDDERQLDVYLLTAPDVTEDHAALISKMRWKRKFNLHLVPVDVSVFATIKTTEGISPAAYNRLYMASILPKTVKRAIYLDSDIIVEKNIAEIYDLDLDGVLFRGVEDSISVFYKGRYDLPTESHHINSGVMLCNLELMRTLRAERMIEKFLDAHRYRIVMGDQQIINEVFHSKIAPLPLEWNVHGSMFDRKWRGEKVGFDNHLTISDVEAAVASPAIIHYTFKRKPWVSLDHPRARTWHRYNEKTPFPVGLPIEEPKVAQVSKPKTTIEKTETKASFLVRLNAYVRSIAQLRLTRIKVLSLSRQIEGLATKVNKKLDKASVEKAIRAALPPTHDPLAYREREALVSRIFRDNGSKVSKHAFVARDFVEALPSESSILTNAMQRDLDGGFNENLKTILRTANIARSNMNDCVLSLILVHRIHTPEFMQCLNTSIFYDVPLLFAEMNFFAAYSTYFDKSSKPAERRCLGFILDDMGSYFDARQPSRLETTLNDDALIISGPEAQRARRLINKIIKNRITKYNKYVPTTAHHGEIEPDAVIVIDQKRGDASIEFARADDKSFDKMLTAALSENSGTIYLKAHPDNLHRGVDNQTLLKHPRVKILGDEVSAPDLLDKASKVYVVSSQMGFEALIRGKEVVVFGLPFFSGWGLTDDRRPLPRRVVKRTIEELFFVSCITNSVYIDPNTGSLIEMEKMLDLILAMRIRFSPQPVSMAAE